MLAWSWHYQEYEMLVPKITFFKLFKISGLTAQKGHMAKVLFPVLLLVRNTSPVYKLYFGGQNA